MSEKISPEQELDTIDKVDGSSIETPSTPDVPEGTGEMDEDSSLSETDPEIKPEQNSEMNEDHPLSETGTTVPEEKDHTSQIAETAPIICRNCGKEVQARFCSWCGQNSRDIRVSFMSLIHDFMGDVFTFDSKLFKTLRPLFFKPGALTAMFMEGKRARFVPPLRLYIFSSIIFFLVLTYMVRSGSDETTHGVVISDGPNIELTSKETKEDDDDSMNFKISDGRFSEDNWLGRLANRKIDAQERKLNAMGAKSAEQAILKAFFSTLPKALFLLMPVFALILKMVYIRRDPFYIDHLIFAFHSHAYLFLLYSAMFLCIKALPGGWISIPILVMIFMPGIYLYLSLRRVYQQPHWKTGIKFLLVGNIYLFCLGTSLTLGLIASIFLA